MPRKIDLSSLTRAERVVMGSGLLLFINAMLPWWYRIPTPSGSFRYNAGLTGLGVLAVGLGGLAALGVVARASVWPEPAPSVDGLLYSGAGLASSVALLVQAASSRARWIGLYVGIALAVALTYGGMRRYAERRAGWT